MIHNQHSHNQRFECMTFTVLVRMWMKMPIVDTGTLHLHGVIVFAEKKTGLPSVYVCTFFLLLLTLHLIPLILFVHFGDKIVVVFLIIILSVENSLDDQSDWLNSQCRLFCLTVVPSWRFDLLNFTSNRTAYMFFSFSPALHRWNFN